MTLSHKQLLKIVLRNLLKFQRKQQRSRMTKKNNLQRKRQKWRN